MAQNTFCSNAGKCTILWSHNAFFMHDSYTYLHSKCNVWWHIYYCSLFILTCYVQCNRLIVIVKQHNTMCLCVDLLQTLTMACVIMQNHCAATYSSLVCNSILCCTSKSRSMERGHCNMWSDQCDQIIIWRVGLWREGTATCDQISVIRYRCEE